MTRLVAENAEAYLRVHGAGQKLENLDQIILLQEQSQKIGQARLDEARGTALAVQHFRAEVAQEPERKAGRQSRHYPGRKSNQFPGQSLPRVSRTFNDYDV